MKLDATDLRYLSQDTFRVLTAVEMGSKNHEIVPSSLIANISGLRNGGVNKCISELSKRGLVKRERNAKYEGYRLTYGGYDFLAIRAFSKRNSIHSVGNQIGVGKEADVYVVATEDGLQRVLKIHRLGRISFRAIKSKRDYLQKRRNASWMYMSRLAAQKEFAFMKVLYDNGFPVPEPIDQARHCVVMSLIDAFPLRQIHELADPGRLYSQLMDLIVRLAEVGLIHGDFNEFNILIVTSDGDEKAEPVLIDFPQMVSTEHENAEFYFNRDVECIRAFFLRRFRYQSKLYPRFNSVVREGKRVMNLDVEVAASGWGKGESRKLEEYMELVKEEETDVSDEEEDEDEDDDDEDDDVEKDDVGSEADGEDGVRTVDKNTESASDEELKENNSEDQNLTNEDDESEVSRADDEVSVTAEVRRKKVTVLTHDQLTAMVANKLERTRLSNQRKHHSKKSVKSVGKQRGSKVKNDVKQLTSLDF